MDEGLVLLLVGAVLAASIVVALGAARTGVPVLVAYAVFFVVALSTVVQGWTLDRVAQALRLVSPAPPVPLEVSPMSQLDLIEFAVSAEDSVNGSGCASWGCRGIRSSL